MPASVDNMASTLSVLWCRNWTSIRMVWSVSCSLYVAMCSHFRHLSYVLGESLMSVVLLVAVSEMTDSVVMVLNRGGNLSGSMLTLPTMLKLFRRKFPKPNNYTVRIYSRNYTTLSMHYSLPTRKNILQNPWTLPSAWLWGYKNFQLIIKFSEFLLSEDMWHPGMTPFVPQPGKADQHVPRITTPRVSSPSNSMAEVGVEAKVQHIALNDCRLIQHKANLGPVGVHLMKYAASCHKDGHTHLFDKGVISAINESYTTKGFYSSIFLVPKLNTLHMCIIIGINVLNKDCVVCSPKFQMESVKKLRNSLPTRRLDDKSLTQVGNIMYDLQSTGRGSSQHIACSILYKCKNTTLLKGIVPLTCPTYLLPSRWGLLDEKVTFSCLPYAQLH